MLVGVGTEDFSKMVELDSDNTLLGEDGVFAERDIVQFVEFEKHKNNGEELAQELLAEFPGQFLSYMKWVFNPQMSSADCDSLPGHAEFCLQMYKKQSSVNQNLLLKIKTTQSMHFRQRKVYKAAPCIKHISTSVSSI